MTALHDELCLAVFITVNSLLFAGAYRFVQWQTGYHGTRAMMDALLLDYVVQYASVCGLGLAQILTPTSLYLTGTMVAVGLMLIAEKGRRRSLYDASQDGHRIIRSGGALFLVGYFIAMISSVWASPIVGDDALMYHLPIPAVWLHDHRLTFFATWFSNPANSYSPLAVETFITWLIAPLGNDLAAHFVQMPAMLLLYFACMECLTAIAGVRPLVAALVVVAALLSRPLVSQSILAKDDVFVASFFLTIIAACGKERLADRLGSWRLGVALGLFFATKYTALQTAPLLLLLINAPSRAGWRLRHWIVATGIVLILAGPWYLRNAIVTGNPLYPVPLHIAGLDIFTGLFFPLADPALRTLDGAWNVLVGGYQGIAPPLMAISIISAFAVPIITFRRFGDPLLRICALGPLLGMLLFFGVSHAPELRYAYPSLILAFMACGIVASLLPAPPALMGGAVILFALGCIWNGFSNKGPLVGFVIIGLVIALAGVSYQTVVAKKLGYRAKVFCAAISVAILSCFVFVYWRAAVGQARESMFDAFAGAYPELTPAWSAALENAPPGATIAYANLAMIRPAMGFDYDHPIVYVPTRRGVRRPDDLPANSVHLRESEFRPYMASLLMFDPDRVFWMDGIHRSGAQVLIVGKTPYAPAPPELPFAQIDPAHFRLILDNNAASVYRIIR